MDFKNLKALMGESFKEGITLEEIDQFFEGKKYVDLSTGNYVAKDKYDKEVEKNGLLTSESANFKKQYDELKPKYDEFVKKETRSKLEGFAKGSKIDDPFIDYAITKIGDQKDDAAFKSAFEEFAKANPRMLVSEQPAPGGQRVVVTSSPAPAGTPTNLNDIINRNIRGGN